MHGGLESIGGVSNDGRDVVEFELPYAVEVAVEGTAPFLFRRWSVEGVAEKAAARKGSRAKKEDNVESYVYRQPSGELAIPGEYFRQAVIHAAKYRQDPRSSRKSAMDLFKAGVAALSDLCSLGVKDWSYLDRRRVTVQRAGVTRVRPAMQIGWRVRCELQCLLPEYISPATLNETNGWAGNWRRGLPTEFRTVCGSWVQGVVSAVGLALVRSGRVRWAVACRAGICCGRVRSGVVCRAAPRCGRLGFAVLRQGWLR